MFECDLVASDSNGDNNFEVSVSSDVDLDEFESDTGTGEPSVDINGNLNSQKEPEIDDEERMVSVIAILLNRFFLTIDFKIKQTNKMEKRKLEIENNYPGPIF